MNQRIEDMTKQVCEYGNLKTFIDNVKKNKECDVTSELFCNLIMDCTTSSNNNKPTKELKKIMKKIIKCFPEEYLAKHAVAIDSESKHIEYHRLFPLKKRIINDDFDKYLEKGDIKRRKLCEGKLSNKDIYNLWKLKRKEKQQQLIASTVSLKRKGLPVELVELINKKLKY